MRQPTALGCYIFAGGFTLGVRKHFNVLAHFEEGPFGTATAAHNLPELRGNIFTDPTSWPIADYAGRVDLVYGNPPCAPWSLASVGRKVPWRLDPRVGCTQRLYSLVEKLDPTVWAWESIRPTFVKGRELVDEMVEKAIGLGYTATALMVEGTRHGVPQRRPRFLLVLSKVEIDWGPTRVRGTPTVGKVFEKPFRTFTPGSEEWSKFFLSLVKRTKPGVRVAQVFNTHYPERVAEGKRTGTPVKGRPSFQRFRLDSDAPSCTLTGGANQIHPTKNRYITIEESAAICGYPRSFKFIGSVGNQYAQVAQAVMPPVGEYVAKMVRAGLEANRKVKHPNFERVEIFNNRLEREPLETGAVPIQSLLFPPPESKERSMKKKLAGGKKTKRVKARTAKGRVARPMRAATQTARTSGRKPQRANAPKSEPRKIGSGARIRQLLQQKVGDDKILTIIHREFLQSRATKADVNWNRRKLRIEGTRG